LSPEATAADDSAPIPTNSRLGFCGLRSIEATDRDGIWSVSGVQSGLVDVALNVRHTPPLTPPMKRMLGSVGWGETASTAPETGLSVIPLVDPLIVGPGPAASQSGMPSWMIAGASRSSSCSTRRPRPAARTSIFDGRPGRTRVPWDFRRLFPATVSYLQRRRRNPRPKRCEIRGVMRP
jgi:hypothetical protein